MEFSVTSTFRTESQIRNTIRDLETSGIGKHFKTKSYGQSVAKFAIKVVPSTGSEPVMHGIFSKGEASITFDIELVLEEIMAMPPIDFRWYIASRIIREMPQILDRLAIADFDHSQFHQDLRMFFEKIGWIANPSGVISFKASQPTFIRDTKPSRTGIGKKHFQIGDCLSVRLSNKFYIGLLVAGKYNKYYNTVLLEFYERRKPTLDDFVKGSVFGTRSGNTEAFDYFLDHVMIACKLVDAEQSVEIVGKLPLIADLQDSGYCYADDIEWLKGYYLEEITIRLAKTKNAALYPNLGFMGKHLIPTFGIIKATE